VSEAARAPQRIATVAAELLDDRRSRADPALASLWTLLEDVKDPEIPVLSIADLGILRAVHREGDTLRVVITPTYSGCPAMHAIADEVRRVLAEAGHAEVRVESRLAPAWTTAWMSESGRARLREYGIAPPVPGSAAHDPAVDCPHCGSARTRRISEFGSTACKALYQCGDCREPFDYFKCI
jgi:ring-1,2-phenylacetyl-CoA epoxidase subunit PaaD